MSTTVQDPAGAARRSQGRGMPVVVTDTASGSRTDRPQLAQVTATLEEGDTLCVWRLDRLGRSLPHLIDTVRGLEERGVGFRSLQESIDTTTPGDGWCSTFSPRWPSSLLSGHAEMLASPMRGLLPDAVSIGEGGRCASDQALRERDRPEGGIDRRRWSRRRAGYSVPVASDGCQLQPEHGLRLRLRPTSRSRSPALAPGSSTRPGDRRSARTGSVTPSAPNSPRGRPPADDRGRPWSQVAGDVADLRQPVRPDRQRAVPGGAGARARPRPDTRRTRRPGPARVPAGS